MTSEGVRIHIHQTPELECSTIRLGYLSKANLIGTAQPKGLVFQGQVIMLACRAVKICVCVCVHVCMCACMHTCAGGEEWLHDTHRI